MNVSLMFIFSGNFYSKLDYLSIFSTFDLVQLDGNYLSLTDGFLVQNLLGQTSFEQTLNNSIFMFY